MDNDRLLNLNEVAMLVGVSVQTINAWYRWKNLHPEHEMAKLIPEFTRQGGRRTRYWKQSDAWKLLEFRKSIPQGRKGIMGDVTQIYVPSSFRYKNKDKQSKKEDK